MVRTIAAITIWRKPIFLIHLMQSASLKLIEADSKQLLYLTKEDDYKDIFKESSHIFIIPMYNEGVFEGAIMMSTPLKYMKEPLDKVYGIIWFSALIAITGSFFILYYFSQKIIIKPLLEINNAVSKISQGEVGKRVKIHSTDEIGELAKAFNSLNGTIKVFANFRLRDRAIPNIIIPATINPAIIFIIVISILSNDTVYLTKPSILLFTFNGIDTLITCSLVSFVVYT